MSKYVVYQNRSELVNSPYYTDIVNSLKKCFRQNVFLPEDNIYVAQIENNAFYTIASIQKEDATTVSIWNVCSSSIGRNVAAVSKNLLVYIIENTPLYPTKWLLLEFENPYWEKALRLYTSIGFLVVEPYEKGLKMTYNPNGIRTITLHLAETKRAEYFGPEINKVTFNGKDIANFGRKIVTYKREYAGFFIVDGETQSKVIAFSNFSIGNYIEKELNYEAASMIMIKNSEYALLHFHTHPNITTDNNLLNFNPPSDSDIIYLLSYCGKKLIREYVFTRNGLFAFGLSRAAQVALCGTNNKPLMDEILEKYKVCLASAWDYTAYSNEVFNRFSSFKIEQILIDSFIEDVLSIETSDIKQVFDMKYWTYDFLESKGSVIDTFFISKDIQISDAGTEMSRYIKLPFNRWDILDEISVADEEGVTKQAKFINIDKLFVGSSGKNSK